MRTWTLTLALVAIAGIASAQCVKSPSCTQASPPAIQTIASGDTIAADACGTVKRITADTAITTSTTDTFTHPSGGLDGCWMAVCNVGATNTITLDGNTNDALAAAGDIALAAGDCISVVQTGTVWRQVSALLNN